MKSALGVPEILSTIVVRRGLIAVMSGILFSLVVAVMLLARPNYRADAMIEIIGVHQYLPGGQTQSTAGNDATLVLTNVNTEVARLNAEPLIQLVYDKIGPRYTTAMHGSGPLAALRRGVSRLCSSSLLPIWLRNAGCSSSIVGDATAGGTKKILLDDFAKVFSTEPIRGSRVIRVSANAPDPALAARMANTLANLYISQKADEDLRQKIEFITWLEKRTSDIDQRVIRADQAVAEYRRATNLIEVGPVWEGGQRAPGTAQLSGMLTSLDTAITAKAQAEARLAHVRKLKAGSQDALNTSEVVDSPQIRDLFAQEAAARQQMAELRATYGVKHPLVLHVAAQLREIRSRIDVEANRILEAAKQDYERASTVVAQLDSEVTRQQGSAANEQIDRVHLLDLERHARADADLDAAFLRSTRQAIESSTWQEPSARLVAAAIPPERPSFPNKRTILPVGFVGSVSLAIEFILHGHYVR